MDDWYKFNERSLPEEQNFYNHLNMRDTADEDYFHTKKYFDIKNLGEFHDLHV